jgi:hypothetical protein
MAIATGTALAIGAVAAAGAGVASSALSRPRSTPARDYLNESRQTLGAQIELAPHLYGVEAQYQPLYNQLASRELAATLLGRSGEPETVSYMRPDGTLATEQLPGIPTRGVIDIGADVIESYGPRMSEALANADPARGRLLAQLTEQAEEGMKLGYALSPDEQRQAVQSIRAGQQARGMGFGPTDIYQEALGVNMAGNARRAQRTAAATSVAGLRQEQLTNPFLAMIGQQTAAAPGLTTGPVFNPGAGQDVYDTNYNAATARQIAAANNRASTMGGIIGGVGQLAGAYAGYRGNQALAQSVAGQGVGPNMNDIYAPQSAALMRRGY